MLPIFVLTRTSNRPQLFRGLRQSLAEQTYPHIHVVHSDTPEDKYVEGDIVVHGRREPGCGYELYQVRLMSTIKDRDGWIIFIDDDDKFTSPDALAKIASYCTDPGVMPVWKVRRESGRISPAVWQGDLSTTQGQICFEGAAFHTSHIDMAMRLIDRRCGADGRMWNGLSKRLKVEWHDEILMEPQRPGPQGKGNGHRVDKPILTVAIPILNRPHLVKQTRLRFRHPQIETLFLPDETDEASIAELEQYRLPYSLAPHAPKYGVPTYASKINHAFRVSETPFIMYASDDIRPLTGWLERALSALHDESIGVLGMNDGHWLAARGMLATHGIVRRSYVEKYGSASLPDAGPVMYEGYRHWWCDVEVSFVARQRNAFAVCKEAKFIHERKHRKDSTYLLGQSFAEADKAIAAPRVPGWPEMVAA